MKERNRALIKRIKQLESNISELNEKLYEDQETPDIPSEEEADENLNFMENDDDTEIISDLNKRIVATRELTGIEFTNYTIKYINSREGLPPGVWREVLIDFVIHEWFKASAQFVESVQENLPVHSLKWTVDGFLARSELHPLVSYIGNNLNGLLTKLKEYATMSQNRSIVLGAFSKAYGNNFQLQQVEKGVLLTWHRNLFQIMWTLQHCKYNEEIIDFFDIEINQRDNEFKKASNGLFEELVLVNQTKESRKLVLMKIGSCASTYMKQHI